MKLLGEWIFFNVLNFEDLAEMVNKKNYKCQITSSASKLIIFSTVLDYILSLQALFFRSNL